VEGSEAAPDVADLEALGYRVERVFPVHRSAVYELVRD
jgi:mannosyltransferase